jgi:hypothetical protein
LGALVAFAAVSGWDVSGASSAAEVLIAPAAITAQKTATPASVEKK